MAVDTAQVRVSRSIVMGWTGKTVMTVHAENFVRGSTGRIIIRRPKGA